MARNKIRIFPYFIISSTQVHVEIPPNIKVELCNEHENGIEVNISLNLAEHKDKCSENAEVFFLSLLK